MSRSILISGGSVIADTNTEPVQADILVTDGRISAIGDLLSQTTGVETLDATNCVVLPGLVDAHVHGEWSVFNSVQAMKQHFDRVLRHLSLDRMVVLPHQSVNDQCRTWRSTSRR